MSFEITKIFGRFASILWICAAVVTSSSAIVPVAQAQQQSESMRRVTYRGIALEQRIPDLWVRNADGAMQRLTLSDSRISQPRSTTLSDGVMLLFRKTTPPAAAAVADGQAQQEQWQVVGQAHYPQAGEEFLLVVQDRGAAAAVSDRYQVTVLPHDDVSREAGLSKFYNYSSVPVGCQIDTEVFMLEPGKTMIRRPAGRGQQSNLGLRVAAQQQGEWEMVFSSVWDQRPHLNALLFIFDDARQPSGITVKRVFDQPSSGVGARAQ